MIRVALYARYSSDNQRDASIEDQLRICREHAERQGWTVVDNYSDRAVSGASMLRPGIQELLQDAQRRRFNIVLAEALDRISRDQEDVAAVFKRLRFADVTIATIAEGDISELHVGLKGTMNALFLKDLAAKTHRGLRGRVEAGKAGGGLCYGYRVVKRLDAAGEAVHGEREIDEQQAAIVRRVFGAFAAGKSPRALARDLNAEKVACPDGAAWTDSTIRGNPKRGTGFLNNELYIGKLVWNRLRYVKDPATGKRVSRLNPPEAWITTDVPDLRIIDDALWQAVKARQADLGVLHANAIAATRASFANRLNGTHRPRSLLSGLLFCGCCGGPYALRGQDRYACSNHVMSGTCSNSRSIPREALETRVLAGLKDKLMAPEVAAEAMRAYQEERNRINRVRRLSGDQDRRALEKAEKAIKEIVAAIENGAFSRALGDRLATLEKERDDLTGRLARAPEDLPDLHPNIPEHYRRKIERLIEALASPDVSPDADEATRSLVERVTLAPGTKRGEMRATLHGDLGTILEWTAHKGMQKNKTDTRGSGMSVSMVAGVGFEPTTFRL
ncbi:MAG TPA: recombinase family protein [Candidatus Binataceae bacterium]|nr:recombinase family protein [Candidatus Binataceae bacterium]